ncbi:MAG: D-2-hydroxyacid dehydrogenase [Erysipelotrichaceae bacterium]|nr:D-2-hydroxyacid dehydrogenase [Erysipelotrichaceae bacterium]
MKTVVLYGAKMNYDQLLDFSCLSEEVTVYDDADETKLQERVKDCDILITKENPVTREMINAFPERLKLIVEAGTGYNNIDTAAARKKGITVCNVPAYSSESVREMAILFILMLSSSMHKQVIMLNNGDKSNFSRYLSVPHNEVYQKTLGIIGEGRIGSIVIDSALHLGMNVLVYSRTVKPDREGVRHVSLDELLKESDYVSLHCPLTPQTNHIINEEALKKMKKTAFLVNTSRGPLIDEKALIKALQEKTIAGAALDVQEVEPLSEDSPLFELDNVILTPHIGWKALETRKRMVSIVKDNIEAFRKGEPINVVN